MPEVVIKGLDQLAAKLERELPEKLAKKVIRDAMRAGADVFVNAISASAPVKSGELAEDIVSRVTVGSVRGALRATAFVGPGFDMTLAKIRKRGKYAGAADRTTVPGIYALFVERGHAPSGMGVEKKAAKRRGHQIEFGGRDTPPHPFMGQAFEAAKDEALTAVIETLRAGIDAAAHEIKK